MKDLPKLYPKDFLRLFLRKCPGQIQGESSLRELYKEIHGGIAEIFKRIFGVVTFEIFKGISETIHKNFPKGMPREISEVIPREISKIDPEGNFKKNQ